MSIEKSLSQIKDLYKNNIEKNGAVSQAVGWNTPESQTLRFEKLTEVVQADNQGFSVNDFGCGYAAHLEFLLQLGMRISSYHGYDLSQEMLDLVKERQADFNGILDLHLSSELKTHADYTFVSGTFNVRFEATEDEWRKYIGECLENINNYSVKGFSFNLLSTYVDWKEPHLFYGDPLYWFDYCKQKFSSKVSLIHDYPLYEWTILVRR